MSLLKMYRRNVTRIREEIAKLQDKKAKEQTKIAALSTKINTASQALLRSSSSASIVKSKLREIERYKVNLATAERNV